MYNIRDAKKLSIIIPIFNMERFLERCLQSLIKQSYKNIELVLVDDGSTDKSNFICLQYAEKFDFVNVIKKNNGGASSARNLGLRYATGDFITFVDADDWVEVETYQICMDLIQRLQGDALVFHSKSVVDEEKFFNKPLEYTILNQKQWLNVLLRKNSSESFDGVCTSIFKRECINNIFFSEEYHVCEDVLFNFQVAKNIKNVILINQFFYHYFCRQGSISAYQKINSYKLEAVTVWRKIFLDYSVEWQPLIRLNVERHKFAILLTAAIFGVDSSISDFKLIKKEYLKSIRAHFFQLLKYKGIDKKRKVALILMFINYTLCGFLGRIFFKR